MAEQARLKAKALHARLTKNLSAEYRRKASQLNRFRGQLDAMSEEILNANLEKASHNI